MGGSTYSFQSRATRSADLGYQTKSAREIFSNKADQTMNPKGVILRESRDSEVNPVTTPIIIALDVTASMGHIPHELVKNALPKLVSSLLEIGVPAPAILFLAIGDHYSDRSPLQVGQFESGDAELDLWLTRTYLEGGGGGNGGESYGLAHLFAAKFCQTDHWDKRKQKGFLITIGDEPNHARYESNAIKEITGNGDIATKSAEELITEAQERWNVFHIAAHNSYENSLRGWKEVLKDNAIPMESPAQLPEIVSNIIKNGLKLQGSDELVAPVEAKTEDKNQEIL